jgi:hypothetical protein
MIDWAGGSQRERGPRRHLRRRRPVDQPFVIGQNIRTFTNAAFDKRAPIEGFFFNVDDKAPWSGRYDPARGVATDFDQGQKHDTISGVIRLLESGRLVENARLVETGHTCGDFKHAGIS